MLTVEVLPGGAINVRRETEDGVWRAAVPKGDAAALDKAAPDLDPQRRAEVLAESGEPEPPAPDPNAPPDPDEDPDAYDVWLEAEALRQLSSPMKGRRAYCTIAGGTLTILKPRGLYAGGLLGSGATRRAKIYNDPPHPDAGYVPWVVPAAPGWTAWVRPGWNAYSFDVSFEHSTTGPGDCPAFIVGNDRSD